MCRDVLGENGKKYAAVTIVSIFVYLGMKYLSPILAPFIFAFLLAGLMNPLVSKLHKRSKINKSVLGGILLFLICLFLGMLVWFLLTAVFTGGGYLARRIPVYQKELCYLLGDCCDNMEKHFGIDGIAIENFVLEQVNVLINNLEINVMPAIMGKSVGYMKNIAGCFSFIVVMLIAVLLIMKDYDRLITDFKEKEIFRGAWEVVMKVVIYVKTFIKAQLIILSIISVVCALTLWLIGMKGGVLYGLLTGMMDTLPFIGTGIMLIPLVVFHFINGRYWQAVVCFCLYAVCALLREFLEPKLIGDKVGVWPVGILFAVFAGIYLFGIAGIIKGPLSLVIICETCKYLWREKKSQL